MQALVKFVQKKPPVMSEQQAGSEKMQVQILAQPQLTVTISLHAHRSPLSYLSNQGLQSPIRLLFCLIRSTKCMLCAAGSQTSIWKAPSTSIPLHPHTDEISPAFSLVLSTEFLSISSSHLLDPLLKLCLHFRTGVWPPLTDLTDQGERPCCR